MPSPSTHVPNPRRVSAGKRNRALRKGLTEDGRRRLRESTLAFQPWRFSTGPRTAAGKAKSARNSKKRQAGPWSLREIRADLTGLRALIGQMQDTRRIITGSI